LREVEPIFSGASHDQPRIVVALDYHHLINEKVFEFFGTAYFKESDERSVQPRVVIELKTPLANLGLHITQCTLFCRPSTNDEWQRCLTNYGGATQRGGVDIPAGWDLVNPAVFRTWANFGPTAGRFISLRFACSANPIGSLYNMDTNWNFEVHVDYERQGYLTAWRGLQKRYVFEKPERINRLQTVDSEYTVADDPNVTFVREVAEAPSFTWRQRMAKYQ
jgi:hypothetical protein